MATLRYAGIGARATPAAVLADMTVMAGWLARTGWQLSSGGADGADSAFAAGAPAGQRTVWLPWRGHNGHRGPGCRGLSAAGGGGGIAVGAAPHPAGGWRAYNGHRGPDCRVLSAAAMAACIEIAAPLHPAWERCSPAVRKLHARNAAVLLGETLDRPVDTVVAFTVQGRVEGGTGMGIRIAEARGIPVLNLGSMSPRAVCERLAAIRRAVHPS